MLLAAASKTQVLFPTRSGCWEPQPEPGERSEPERFFFFYHITQSDEKNFVSVHKNKVPLCYTASSIVKGALSHGTDLNTPSSPPAKKAILSLLVLLALTCVVVFIFSSHWAEISTALVQLSLWQVLLVLAIGLTYPPA